MSDTQIHQPVQVPALTLFAARDHLRRARDYFDHGEDVTGTDFTQLDSSDKDGLLNFILVSEEIPDYLEPAFDAQRKNLLSLAGVGTAFARKVADNAKNPLLVYDPMLWQDIYNHFPLMGPSSFEEKTFHEETIGVEIATRFIETIFMATVSAGAALNSFREFLKGQGDTIRAGTSGQGTTYRFGSICIVMETIHQGQKQILVPKLKGYFITFSQSEKNWTAGCASVNKFQLDFTYRTSTSIFNYELMENAVMKKEFEDFIFGRAKDDIEKSKNFFEQDDWSLGK